jgi:arsenite methyltransferase
VSPAGPETPVALPSLEALLADPDGKACCATIYGHPAVRWLLGGELHPGGEATTRRALELIGVGPGDRLLDVASGAGTSARLAAREFGCTVVGVEYGEAAVDAANAAAAVDVLERMVEFRHGDAEALPLDDDQFDAVLCECSLCLFPNKRRAVAEMRRVLRPGGRLALSDVVVDRNRLPAELDGALAAVACVGQALSRDGYEDLLSEAGLRLTAAERRDDDAAKLAQRVQDRLRGARLLGVDRVEGSPIATTEAIQLVAAARLAISERALGYAIFAAALP